MTGPHAAQMDNLSRHAEHLSRVAWRFPSIFTISTRTGWPCRETAGYLQVGTSPVGTGLRTGSDSGITAINVPSTAIDPSLKLGTSVMRTAGVDTR